MKNTFLPAAIILSTSHVMAADEPISLTLHIEGGEPSTGQVIATLFASEGSYMKEPSAELATKVDARGNATIIFERQALGEYAVSVIYDKNLNGNLDTGFFGIPKEKIGFSNNAKPRMGPASYSLAKFTLTHDATEMTVRLGRASRN